LSVGRETTGQISARRGSVSAAYNAAVAASTIRKRRIDTVQRQGGSRIIKPQKGKTKRLLSQKIVLMFNTAIGQLPFAHALSGG
jgi:hypothetical protein